MYTTTLIAFLKLWFEYFVLIFSNYQIKVNYPLKWKYIFYYEVQ